MENNYIIVYNLFDPTIEELHGFFVSYFINPSNESQLNNSLVMRSQSISKNDVYDIKCSVDGRTIYCAFVMGSSTEDYQATLCKIILPDLISSGEKTLRLNFNYGGIQTFQNNCFVTCSSYEEETRSYQYYFSILDYPIFTSNYFAIMPPFTVNTVYQFRMLPNKTLIMPVINIDLKTNTISNMTIVSRDLSDYNEEGKQYLILIKKRKEKKVRTN